MPLTQEQVYNELSGEDVREILLTRCADVLNSVSDFRSNISLPRVKMELRIQIEVHGRNPPTFAISNDLTLIARESNPDQLDLPIVATHELSASINADTSTLDGQPPDQVRVEHGVPINVPVRGPFGNIEDKQVVVEDGIKYAFNIKQDYGPARYRTGNESPIAAEVIQSKNGGGGRPEVSADFSRVRDGQYADRYDQIDANGQVKK